MQCKKQFGVPKPLFPHRSRCRQENEERGGERERKRRDETRREETWREGKRMAREDERSASLTREQSHDLHLASDAARDRR